MTSIFCVSKILVSKDYNIDYIEQKDYPFSIIIKKSKYNKIKKPLLLIFSETELNSIYFNKVNLLRIAAIPTDLAQYANNFCLAINIQASALSEDKLNIDELEKIIITNIEISLPIMVLALIKENKWYLGYQVIVGFLNKKVLLLNTDKQGINRIFTMDIKELFENMDLSIILSYIKLVNDKFPAFITRKFIKKFTKQAVSIDKINSLKRYNFIIFTKEPKSHC
jgi:hypothetical protein